MTEAAPFDAKMVERERIAYHEDAITHLNACIAEMRRGDIRHYSEDDDGRLSVDSTKRMIKLSEASLRTHRAALRLWTI